MKRWIKYIIYVCIAIVLIPIFIDFIILGNKFPSNVNNNDWIGFLGSYVGALIGAVITLVGVIMTINYTRKEANEDRRLSIAPYIKYTMLEKTLKTKQHNLDVFYFEKDDNTEINTTVIMKNIGLGPVLNIEVLDIYFNGEFTNRRSIGVPGVIEKDEEILLLIDLRLKLEEIKEDDVIEDKTELPDSLFRFNVPDNYKNVGGELSFKIKYKDLMNNEYEQIVKIKVIIALESNINNPRKWNYTKPKLRIKEIENTKITK